VGQAGRAIVFALLACARVAAAQPQHLKIGEFDAEPDTDEVPQVDLLTFGVGPEIFEKYGHAAICLRYTKHPSVCFNFGATDFDAGLPLIWNFIRGKQEFWVEPSALDTMLAFYRAEDRDIFRQTLPITNPQRRVIEAALLATLKAQAGHYDYDHFFANCSTQVRDVIDRATGGALRAADDTRLPVTFRQIGHAGLAELPALVALSDFVIGRQADDRPTHWEAMFSPPELRAGVATHLHVAPEHLYARKGPPFPTSGSTGRLPMLALGLLFALPLLVARWRTNGQRGAPLLILDGAFAVLLGYLLAAIAPIGMGAALLFGALLATPLVLANVSPRGEALALVWVSFYLGLWGIVIWGVAVVTHIPGIRWNEVALVVVPFDAALPFVGEALRQRYARVRVAGLALVSLLCAIGVLHQPLWIPLLTAFVPLAIVAFDPPFGLLPPRPISDGFDETTEVTKNKKS